MVFTVKYSALNYVEFKQGRTIDIPLKTVCSTLNLTEIFNQGVLL